MAPKRKAAQKVTAKPAIAAAKKGGTKRTREQAEAKKEEEKKQVVGRKEAKTQRKGKGANQANQPKSKKSKLEEEKKGGGAGKGGKPRGKPIADESKKEESKKKESKKEEGKTETKIVKVVKKGNAVVDKSVPMGGSYHVYEEPTKVYHASLMWSDLRNNNNKFYIVQLLQSDAVSTNYSVFNRWGRVGVDGQHAIFKFTDLNSAKHQFNKKLNEKVNKGYTEITISFDQDDDGSDVQEETKTQVKGIIYIYIYIILYL